MIASSMRYLSLFSGIGGLEADGLAPVLCCELDRACHPLLAARFPDADLHDDVRTLEPPPADVVAGGWPCQDLSVAGLRRGLAGERSGLFFAMLGVAKEARAHTIVAENVPNLLAMQGGGVFRLVREALAGAGYAHVAWRTLNARAFGLPHQRRRVILVASREAAIARALHRPLPEAPPADAPPAAGFYWTAGLHAICYSAGFVPTLKVGSSLSIPSPPGVFFDGTVRKATPAECLRLQGFDHALFAAVRPADAYRMAGNAVAAPVGRFALGSLAGEDPGEVAMRPPGDRVPEHGLWGPEGPVAVLHPEPPLAASLGAFLDLADRRPLSARAAAGLLTRLDRAGKPCPPDLRAALEACV